MRKCIISLLCLISYFCCGLSYASTDLLTVYHDALANDPQFKEALAQRDIVSTNIPLAWANLLPQLTAQGNLSKSRVDQSGLPRSTDRSSGFQLTLQQNIFNYTNWLQLASAHKSVKAAYATYTSAIQSVIERTAQAYFNVLLAEDNLRYTVAEKEAFYKEYQQAKISFQVGVKTITDVYNAKAAYDSSVSDYVSAKNNLADQNENLAAITGKQYKKLSPLKTLPLVNPNPSDIDQWTHIAMQRNWQLIASKYSMLSAHDAILAAEGGHYPTVALTGSFSNQYTSDRVSSTSITNGTNNTVIAGSSNGRTKTLSAGLQVNVPIYQGGQVSAQVQQAISQYDLAAGQYEETYRSIVNQTRQAYLNAISGISKVHADIQTIISQKSSLEGTKESYKVGTRTMVNVLEAEKNLYNAERLAATDRYAYIMSLIQLKQAAGTLTVDDVAKVNQWLSANTHFSKKTANRK